MLDCHWSHMEVSTLPLSVLTHLQNEGLAVANEPSALCVCSRQENAPLVKIFQIKEQIWIKSPSIFMPW